MEKWVITQKRADFNQIGQQFHIDPGDIARDV